MVGEIGGGGGASTDDSGRAAETPNAMEDEKPEHRHRGGVPSKQAAISGPAWIWGSDR